MMWTMEANIYYHNLYLDKTLPHSQNKALCRINQCFLSINHLLLEPLRGVDKFQKLIHYSGLKFSSSPEFIAYKEICCVKNQRNIQTSNAD